MLKKSFTRAKTCHDHKRSGYSQDTSTKVMQTMQQSMNRSELDLTYVTSRLIVTSFPAEGIESAYRHHIDDVRAALDARHGTHYAVFNVSGRSYAASKFNSVRVTDCGWPHHHAPPLRTLYASVPFLI